MKVDLFFRNLSLHIWKLKEMALSLQETAEGLSTQVWTGVGRVKGNQQGMLQCLRASESQEAVSACRHGNTPRWMAVGQGMQQVLELGKCSVLPWRHTATAYALILC